MTNRHSARWLFLLFAMLCDLGSVGCIYIDQELAERPTKDRAQIVPAHQKLLPNHAALLEATGWLEFVDSNIDAVEYRNKSALESSTGQGPGLAWHENGRRIASVALKGRSDEEAVAALVHLAAHLSGVAQVGHLYDHDSALIVEARFRQDLADLTGEPIDLRSRTDSEAGGEREQ
jgi:hypothetical protein